MKTKDIHFLIMVVVVIGFLVVLSLTGRQRYLTKTPPHLSAASDAECFSCHDEGKQFPMTKEHRVDDGGPGEHGPWAGI